MSEGCLAGAAKPAARDRADWVIGAMMACDGSGCGSSRGEGDRHACHPDPPVPVPGLRGKRKPA